jgi:hypothetical protein
MHNFYSNGLINKALKKDKSLQVIQRWLRIYYKVRVDRASLEMRKKALSSGYSVQTGF